MVRYIFKTGLQGQRNLMSYKMFPSRDTDKPEKSEISSPGNNEDAPLFDDNIIDVQEETDEIAPQNDVNDTALETDAETSSQGYSATSSDDTVSESDELSDETVEVAEVPVNDDIPFEENTSFEGQQQLDNSAMYAGDHDQVTRSNTPANDQAPAGLSSGSSSNSGNTTFSNPPPASNSSEPVHPAGPVKKNRKWQYAGIFLVLLLIIGGSFVVIFQSFGGEVYPTHDRVAVIYVQGYMITGNIPSGFGYATSEAVCDNLRRAAADESVKAIVMRVNSGGGSPVASEEIIVEMKKVQDQGIPIVVSMGDVAASAAYHISAPADLIMASPSTVTGSIGVISVYTNRSAYYEDEGIEYEVIKSGEFKDMGRDWRGLSDEEREYADSVVLEIYDLFIEDIARDRDMSLGEVKDIADGRIYTGVTARQIGLVDEFGNLYDAIDAAAELGGIEGDPSVHHMNKPFISSLLFGSEYVPSDELIRQLASYYEDSPVGKIMM